ncbi:MAG: NADH-quinone oxidoreductase subunit A [Myxococcota bacterium]|nr:NADH-quinone oxidoreductase subunit A [Myxococcota bacterium]
MVGEYLGVLVLLGVAIAIVTLMMAIQFWAGPKRSFPAKQEPVDRGEQPDSSPRKRFSVRFYLVAILFVVFDVGAISFYPWGATFREVGVPGLVAIGVFTVPLVVGLAYEWAKGALEW